MKVITMRRQEIETEYANTDFDLRSSVPFDALHEELLKYCHVLHYTKGDDGKWYAIMEANRPEESNERNAPDDILSMLAALKTLSEQGRKELAACEPREFNVGFHCWDSWGFVYQIPQPIVRMVADASCSIAITLYPMRNVDGTPKI